MQQHEDEVSDVVQAPRPKPETELDVELGVVRKEADSLILQEGIDKSTALGVLKLLHTMENMLFRVQFEGERTIEALKNELTVSKLTHKQADMLETLSGDIANAHQRLVTVETLSGEIENARQRLMAVENAISTAQVMRKGR